MDLNIAAEMGKVYLIRPSSNCRISELVGLKNTAGYKRAPGSSLNFIRVSCPAAKNESSPTETSITQPTSRPKNGGKFLVCKISLAVWRFF